MKNYIIAIAIIVSKILMIIYAAIANVILFMWYILKQFIYDITKKPDYYIVEILFNSGSIGEIELDKNIFDNIDKCIKDGNIIEDRRNKIIYCKNIDMVKVLDKISTRRIVAKGYKRIWTN